MKYRTEVETYRITYSVPVPQQVVNLRTKYPFPFMSVGHSFLVPRAKGHSVRNCAYSYGKTHNMKFICRAAPGGIRVWRIA
jgi:hypothetical protein